MKTIVMNVLSVLVLGSQLLQNQELLGYIVACVTAVINIIIFIRKKMDSDNNTEILKIDLHNAQTALNEMRENFIKQSTDRSPI